MENTKEAAKAWIEAGNPCIYRCGWEYRGASAVGITKEEALKMLPEYSFGMGFNELSWRKCEGIDVLQFNKLSVYDLE